MSDNETHKQFESIMSHLQQIIVDREKRMDTLINRLQNLVKPPSLPEEGESTPTRLMDYDFVRTLLSDALLEIANNVGHAMHYQWKITSSHPLLISAEKERNPNA